MYDNDEHVWLYAVGLVGEYMHTHTHTQTFRIAGLREPDKTEGTLNDLDFLFLRAGDKYRLKQTVLI